MYLLTALLVPKASRAQSLEILHSFSGPDGSRPSARLVGGPNGLLYGTTVFGGASDAGTIFAFTPEAVPWVVASFNITNGMNPYTGLTSGTSNKLYGTSTYGGLTNFYHGLGYGTFFEVEPGGKITTLAYFDGTNGATPYGDMLFARNGVLYGPTDEYNGYGSGTIFHVNQGGLSTVARFDLMNGGTPNGPLIELPDSSFYGTTVWGGPPNSVNPYGSGTVFRLSKSNQITTLAAFDGIVGGRPTGMIRATDGNFYGTTLDPGAGTVFKMTPTGALSVLSYFHGRDGDYPEGLLLQARDGFLYGTTRLGGAFGAGNVFRISTNGALTSIVTFDGTNGTAPSAGLIQASDGNLYGTTYAGGASNLGTIFRIVFPKLTVEKVASELVCSWPTNQIGYTLQTSPSLIGDFWTDSTDPVSVAQGMYWVTNPIAPNDQFFRLKK